MKRTHFLLCLLFAIAMGTLSAQDEKQDLWSAENFNGLEFRSIGPAFMSGRIADIAIHPQDDNVWYVAVGSGGVWKTKNAGVTWTPIFDNEAVYSTGCVTIDPNNPNTVWVGTGENVGGRHMSFGDGIYRSKDGGASWTNMGLPKSEHISKIIVHPDNSDVVFVASQGPLWSKGGERGFYKTTDGGKTWKRTLGNDDWTGVTDIAIDPRDPQRLYAATWDRHRTVAAYMGGGPGTGLHRSTDGGETWEKLTSGLPTSNMGKIGLAISPQNPDVLYAAIELDHRKGGVYRSSDRGTTWEKRSDAVSGATGPHYYQELYACPHNFDRLYLVDVRMQISDDGGKSFRRMKEGSKHSDNHAVAFRADDPDYLLVGTDGGIYESFDLAENWRYIDNLPLTQFYKIAVDDAEPFYNVYGGTQDNSTEAGPSRTDKVQGIQNSDWRVVLNWDGHQPATEPGNPDIVYGQRQQGTLARIDNITGEVIDIQPQPAVGEDYERYNWDAPILVSPHSPTQLFFASQRLWRSDDRGDSWTAISGDLTRNENRLALPIMGKQQSWNNAWDLFAMSNYNTITSIAESPKQRDLIYIGTDDGLLQITADGGKNWTKTEVQSLGLPERAYINDIKADMHDVNTAYMALDNHKEGDYKPYLLKSNDMGKTWKSITNGLPETLLIWRIVQDHVNPDLLFLGTEFGIYFSVNGGDKWVKMNGGLPNISFRDLAIQKRENDLVAGSFGRSIYILDDYTALREVSETQLQAEASLFPTRKAWWYIPRSHLGFDEKRGNQGASHYVADNPDFGAVFTYYIGEDWKSKKQIRAEKEQALAKEGKDIAFAGWEALNEERTESMPKIWLTVKDSDGNVVRRIAGETSKGFHRTAWDLRHPSFDAIELGDSDEPESGMLAIPGTYTVTLSKQVGGLITELSNPQSFEVVPLRKGALDGATPAEATEFWQEFQETALTASALGSTWDDAAERVQAMHKAMVYANGDIADMSAKLYDLHNRLDALDVELNGDKAKNTVGEKTPPTVGNRLFAVSRTITQATYGPTKTAEQTLAAVKAQLADASEKLAQIQTEIEALATQLQAAGAPWMEGDDLPRN